MQFNTHSILDISLSLSALSLLSYFFYLFLRSQKMELRKQEVPIRAESKEEDKFCRLRNRG